MKIIKAKLLMIAVATTSLLAEVTFKFHYTDDPDSGFNHPANAWAREAVEKAGKIVGSSLDHNATINIQVRPQRGNKDGVAGFYKHNFMQDIFHGVNDSAEMYGPLEVKLSHLGWIELGRV